jgi:glucose-1-phosphate cytidylyltransferase
MTVVLFCGGRGLRLGDHTRHIPKPLVRIGGETMLGHLMRYYAWYGHRHFVLCLGYQADVITRHFLRHRECGAVETRTDGVVRVHLRTAEHGEWLVDLVPMGPEAGVGDRLRLARPYVEGPVFLANYADGLSDLDLPRYLDAFTRSGALVSLVSVPDPATFHLVSIGNDGMVDDVRSAADAGIRINGGFFAMRREIFDVLRPGDDLMDKVLPRLVAARRVFGYEHHGFWACVDTQKDWQAMEAMVASGVVPWKVWQRVALDAPLHAPVGAMPLGAPTPAPGF